MRQGCARACQGGTHKDLHAFRAMVDSGDYRITGKIAAPIQDAVAFKPSAEKEMFSKTDINKINKEQNPNRPRGFNFVESSADASGSLGFVANFGSYFSSFWEKGTKLHFKSPTAERRHVLCVGVGGDRTHASRPGGQGMRAFRQFLGNFHVIIGNWKTCFQ
jgi:hypothetical protein